MEVIGIAALILAGLYGLWAAITGGQCNSQDQY